MNSLRVLRERARPNAIRPNAIRLGRILDRIKVLRPKRRKTFRRLNPAILTHRRDWLAKLR